MNYRHAFHAGNFADVLKHAVLARVLTHLREKPAPFRVVDTHAGSGLYDLAGAEAARSREWEAGIGLLMRARLSDEVAGLLSPYLDVVRSLNPGGLAVYPGSPALAQALMRNGDRLVACELQPDAAKLLAARFRGDRRVKVLALDGWTALNAALPPPERRGLVLIDPPFEQPGEFERLAAALAAAHRKWRTGIYLLWYPIKSRRQTEPFGRRLAALGIARMLRVELTINAEAGGRLNGCGLVVVNPPWRLAAELDRLLPALAACLGGGHGAWRQDWLAGET
jgi:23S rRNA (adenine2030-N6)-methyltransferase